MLTLPLQGKTADFRIQQCAITHLLDFTCAKSLCNWPFFCVRARTHISISQGNYLALCQVLRACCHVIHWRGGEKQTHKRWYNLSRQTACIHSISWARLVGYVYFKSIQCKNNSPFVRKSVSEGWAVVKRKVFYCSVCLYTFQFASPDSHQQSEQKPSEPSSARDVPVTEHLAIQAKIKAAHPNKWEQSCTPSNLPSAPSWDVPRGAVTLAVPTKTCRP